MRTGLLRAAALATLLAAQPPRKGTVFGPAAKDLSEAELRRIGGRLERRAFSADRGLHPAALDLWSRKQRRARQTHPGKRGQRKRP